MKTYLSKLGYVLNKSEFDKETIRQVKRELVAKPIQDDKFYTTNAEFPVYKETLTKLFIPVQYGISKFGVPTNKSITYKGKNIPEDLCMFNGTLLPEQEEPYTVLYEKTQESIPTGGVMCLSTGSGKTFLAIKLITEVKRKTLVVVNKISLLEQWTQEINKFAPNLRVGKVQGQNIDIVEKDVIIGMLQSITKDLPNKMFDDISMMIIDEAHNVSSRVFSKILFKACCPVMIGLSATPNRADGLDYVLYWHIGSLIYKSKNVKRKGKDPEIRTITLDSTEYKDISIVHPYSGRKQLQFTSMLSDLIKMPKRNKLIIEIIKTLFENVSKRKVLLLTERRTHAEELYNLLKEARVNFSFGLFLGGMKIDVLNENRKSDLIIATIAAFSEGVSEKDLNTLILTTPKKFIGHIKNSSKNESGKMEQIVGRIFRKEHTDIHPLIIDIFDNFSVYKTHGKQRQMFYKQHFNQGQFINQSINLDAYELKDITIDKVNTKRKFQYCILD